MKAQFLSIGSSDLVKGAIIAGLTVIMSGAAECLTLISQTPPVYPSLQTLEHIAIAGLSSFAIYICKNFLTNSHDEFLTTEK